MAEGAGEEPHIAPGAAVHRFRGFELDAARLTLTGPEGPVAAEPRTIEVLAYLLAHRGRLVGKEELVEAVWRGQAVSDAAVSRAVYLARRAVGDDATRQGVIATVHGRGYRISPGLEVTSHVSAAGQSRPTMPTGASPGPGRRRFFALLAAVVIIGLALAAWWAKTGAPPAPPPSQRAVRIAVVPPSSSSRLAGLAVCDALVRRLRSAPGVVVRDCAVADELAVEATSLTELAARLGADAVVTGGLADGRLGLELLALPEVPGSDGGSRRRVLPEQPLADPLDGSGDLDAAADRLADRLLTWLGRSVSEPRRGPSPDPRAMSLYLRAIAETGVSCVGGGRFDLLAAATGAAPDLEDAWLALAREHLARASLCGEHPGHYTSALEALDHSGKTAPTRLARAALAAEVLIATGRIEEAYVLVERTEAGGTDPRLDWAAARALVYAGRPAAAAVRARRALEADPDHDLHGWATGLLAAELAGPPPIRFRDDPAGIFGHGLVALRAGEPEAAAIALRPAFRADPANQYARLAEALQAVAEGAPDQAFQIARELDRVRLGQGGGDPVVDYRIAQLLALAGDADGGAAALLRALDGGFAWAAVAERDALWRRSALAMPPADLLAAARRAGSLGRRAELLVAAR